jgi:DNA polymerase-3 subunit alpha
VDLKRVGKRPLEMLARAGAFDQLDPNRRRVFEGLDALVAYSAAVHEAQGSAQVSLFGDGGDDLPEPRLPNVADWLPTERLGEEHTAIGFYLSGHPLDDYMTALRRQGVKTLAEVEAAARKAPLVAKMAGAVAARKERKSAKGNRFAFVGLSDPTGLYEVTVFSDTLEAGRAHLEPGQNVVIQVEATAEADQLKLLCRSVQPIDAAVADAAPAGLKIYVDATADVTPVLALLDRVTGEAKTRARAPVSLCLLLDDPDLGEVELTSASRYAITPQVKGAVKSLPGVVMVEDL